MAERKDFGVCIVAFLIEMKFLPQMPLILCCLLIIVHSGLYEGVDSGISAGDVTCGSSIIGWKLDFVRDCWAWVGVAFGF